jgi:hypothetical protein
MSGSNPVDWADQPIPSGGVIEAFVWWCGDEHCDCTEAQIRWRDLSLRPVGIRTLWQGTFRSGWPYEYEPRDGPSPSTELKREAARLRRKHNALFHRIVWPWNDPVR